VATSSVREGSRSKDVPLTDAHSGD